MKVAIPTWMERISPVFDVASRLLVLDIEDGREQGRSEASLDQTESAQRAEQLAACGVDLLICGGISRMLELTLADKGIRTVARICGPVEDVIQAFLAGRLKDEKFLMPGCCGGRPPMRGGCRGGRRWRRGAKCE